MWTCCCVGANWSGELSRGCDGVTLAARRAWSPMTVDRMRQRLSLHPYRVMEELEFWANWSFRFQAWTKELRVCQVVWFHVTRRVQLKRVHGRRLEWSDLVVFFVFSGFSPAMRYISHFSSSVAVFYFCSVCMCVLSTLLPYWCFAAQGDGCC